MGSTLTAQQLLADGVVMWMNYFWQMLRGGARRNARIHLPRIALVCVVTSLIAMAAYASTIAPEAAAVVFDRSWNVSDAHFLTEGPDGRMWMASSRRSASRHSVVAIDRNRTMVSYALPHTKAGASAVSGMCVGPDGKIWVSVASYRRHKNPNIYRFDTSGRRTLMSVPPHVRVRSLATGTDGRVWFLGPSNRIGRMSVDGKVTFVQASGASKLVQLIQGPDDAMWAVGPSELVRISASGKVRRIAQNLNLPGVAVGPGDGVWVTGELAVTHVFSTMRTATIGLQYPYAASSTSDPRDALSVAAGPANTLVFVAGLTIPAKELLYADFVSLGSVGSAGQATESQPADNIINLGGDWSDNSLIGSPLIATGIGSSVWALTSAGSVSLFAPDSVPSAPKPAPKIHSIHDRHGRLYVVIGCSGQAGQLCTGALSAKSAGKMIGSKIHYGVGARQQTILTLDLRPGADGSVSVTASSLDPLSNTETTDTRKIKLQMRASS